MEQGDVWTTHTNAKGYSYETNQRGETRWLNASARAKETVQDVQADEGQWDYYIDHSGDGYFTNGAQPTHSPACSMQRASI